MALPFVYKLNDFLLVFGFDRQLLLVHNLDLVCQIPYRILPIPLGFTFIYALDEYTFISFFFILFFFFKENVDITSLRLENLTRLGPLAFLWIILNKNNMK